MFHIIYTQSVMKRKSKASLTQILGNRQFRRVAIEPVSVKCLKMSRMVKYTGHYFVFLQFINQIVTGIRRFASQLDYVSVIRAVVTIEDKLRFQPVRLRKKFGIV